MRRGGTVLALAVVLLAMSAVARGTLPGGDGPAAFRFHLEMDGVVEAAFKEVALRPVLPEDYAACGAPAGTPLRGVLVLERGFAKTSTIAEWFFDNPINLVSKSGAVVELSKKDGTPIFEWTFEKGWPCRYEGPRFDAESGALAIEVIEIAHEGLKIQ